MQSFLVHIGSFRELGPFASQVFIMTMYSNNEHPVLNVGAALHTSVPCLYVSFFDSHLQFGCAQFIHESRHIIISATANNYQYSRPRIRLVCFCFQFQPFCHTYAVMLLSVLA